MAAKAKRFTILDLSDRDNFGYNEKTLPILIALMNSARPDYLNFVFSGVTGYFMTSARSLIRVEKAVQDAEKLRDSDKRFSSLGIGLAEGSLIADFHWWGGLKKSGTLPLGGAVNEAVRASAQPDMYRETLGALKNKSARQGV